MPVPLPRQLAELEAEAIHILRETAAGFAKPVLLYSIGKDLQRPASSRTEGIFSGHAAVPVSSC